MEIKKATFVVSNSDYRKCPDTGLPEYAFIGRSNVGKSSLINMLTNNKSLAKTSVKPGKTQLINHFLINNEWYLVDLPGYGYARISKESRDKWQKMITDYLLNRETLMNVYVLVDSRIPPQQIDIDFINWLGENGVPFAIVFTKGDKLGRVALSDKVTKYKERLLEEWEELPPVFVTSSETKLGGEELTEYIEGLNDSMNNE
jgi:GTP-binding protein